MKLCVLETSPAGPVDNGDINKRKDFVEDENCDFYFVTHNEEHSDAIEFRKGHRWASNRNYLAEYAFKMEKYDYFWFTDYDVDYTSNTKLSVVEQILQDLEKTHPAILVCFDPHKQNSNNHKNIYLPPDSMLPIRSALMTNNQMKIVHKSLMKYFFPMPLRFGSIWDTCLYFNLLEIPFIGHTAMTYNVYGSGLVSEPTSQGNQSSMNQMFCGMKDVMLFKTTDEPAKTSLLYQMKSRHQRLLKNSKDVDYYDKEHLSGFFKLEGLEQFRNDG